MNFLTEAILALRPGAQFSTHEGAIIWHDTEQDQPSDSDIAAKQSELQAEYDSKAYARARSEAYASIAEQLDMQYWDSVNGSRTWLDHIESVKDAHPKP